MTTTIKRQRKAKTIHTSAQSRRTGKDFDTTVLEATQAMPRQRRIFSKFIHIGAVSRISDLFGSTIARPNAILFGAISSFALTLTAYLFSKKLGYSLSGSEPIVAFLLGWVAGILFDTLKLLYKKR